MYLGLDIETPGVEAGAADARRDWRRETSAPNSARSPRSTESHALWRRPAQFAKEISR